MNPASEVIEQIADAAPPGRTLAWLCAVLRAAGTQAPLGLLAGMVRDGLVELQRSDGSVLEPWERAAVLRAQAPDEALFVVATSRGLRS